MQIQQTEQEQYIYKQWYIVHGNTYDTLIQSLWKDGSTCECPYKSKSNWNKRFHFGILYKSDHQNKRNSIVGFQQYYEIKKVNICKINWESELYHKWKYCWKINKS